MAEYGYDISNDGDLDPNLTIVSGKDALVQAVFRRWDTPNAPFEGGLFYDSDYGTDIRQWVNTPAVASRIQAALEAEALKDDRVSECRVKVELLKRNDDERRRPPIKITAEITGSDADSFALTVNVSELSVELLQENS